MQTKQPINNPFKELSLYVDVRHRLPTHPDRRYKCVGVKRKTDIEIYHSQTANGSAEAFARYHVEHLEWPGIGYAFVIEKNGIIKHCQDIDLSTANDNNDSSVHIYLIGDYRSEDPSYKQLQSLKNLHRKLIEQLPCYRQTRAYKFSEASFLKKYIFTH